MASDTNGWQAVRRRIQARALRVAPVLVLLIGAIASAWGFARIRGFEAAQFQMEFERRGRTVVGAFDDTLDENVRLLDTMASFSGQIADDSEPPALADDTAYWRRQIELYRANMRGFALWVDAIIGQYPAVRALGWISAVGRSDRAGYEWFARATVEPSYLFRERNPDGTVTPAGARPNYFPIFSVEPRTTNDAVMGLDVGFEGAARDALQRACASGDTTRTVTSRLFQPSDGPVLLVIRPIRSATVAASASASCDATIFAFGAFRLPEVIDAALARVPDQAIGLRVTHEDAGTGAVEVLYTSRSLDSVSGQATEVRWSLAMIESIALTVTPTRRLLAMHRTWQPWVVLILGLLLTGAAVVALTQAERRHAKSERVVADRTRQLQVANQLLETETRRKAELEARLRQSQKMEAIGTLAGGIAHDFNNILGALTGYMYLAKEAVPSDSKAFRLLLRAEKAGERATGLVSQILGFSRRQDENQQRTPIKIHGVIEDALSLLRKSIPTTIAFQCDISSACGMVLGDATQIHQVVMNLTTNAYLAMREHGGTLTVGLEETQVGAAVASAHQDLGEGRYVRLRVSDTGDGMSDATMARIFEPYYTTRAVGDGTGLGLSIVLGIVQRHAGTVTVQSTLNEGSTFDVYFPVHTPDQECNVGSGESERTPIPRGKGEHILFIDDELPIVDASRAILKGLAYEVTAWTCSVQALQAFRATPDRFDIVITDQTMPDLSGLELAKKILEIRPNVPILLCTGFSDTVTRDVALAAGVFEYLPKPVVPSALAHSIRLALDARTS